MELNNITEGLNDVQLSVYRAAMKLQLLQRRCHLDSVLIGHIRAVLPAGGGANEVTLSREEATLTLGRMFCGVTQEAPSHVTTMAAEETCSAMFEMFDRGESGRVSAASLSVALNCLSAESLQVKLRALVSVAEDASGAVSRSSLRALLKDVSQVPTGVQEEGVFGGVEAAVKSCFKGVLTPTASSEHVLSWLQSGPRLLLWLPTLCRMSVSYDTTHSVRCHICKTFPISGLRYRCLKCVRVQVCQSCFLSERCSRKHKATHPVMEFCTQPTWQESLSLLVQNVRHALLPRRYTQKEADRRRGLMWAEPDEADRSRTPLPSDDISSGTPSSSSRVSSPRLSSKSLQTEETPADQAAAILLTEVRNLQTDKRLLEEQLQAWQLSTQSERSMLEDRCVVMETTMEELRENNLHLEQLVLQALSNAETQQDARRAAQHENMEDTETEDMRQMSPSQTDSEEDVPNEDEGSTDELGEDTPLTPVPTDLWDNYVHYEEDEPAGDGCLCPADPQGAEPGQVEDMTLCEDEDCGTYGPEVLLQETVDRLKSRIETHGTERQTGDSTRVELLEAAEHVGESIRHLVDAVRTHAHSNTQQLMKRVYCVNNQ